MAKYRDYAHQDPFYASTVDALMEFTGVAVENLRLSCPNATTVRATAGAASAQVSIGIDGLWRYRSSNYDLAISGGAGIKDIFAVAVTGNSFSNSPTPDTDNTNYAWELRAVASGGTPSSVAAYRKIGEVDWDGAKITGIRQLAGLDDATQPISPTAITPGAPALVAKGAAGQTANISEVKDSAGTVLFYVNPSGGVYASGNLSSGGDAYIAGGDIYLAGEQALWRTGADAFTVGGKLTAAGLDAQDNTITNVGTPVNADDAATRQFVLDNVAGGTNPTGAAGGALSGTYPNPGLAATVAGGGIGISSNVLSVAAGTGITQNTDGVGIDTAVVPQKAVAQTFTATQTFDPSTDALNVKLVASATADALQVRNAGDSATLAYINNAGKVFGTGLDASSQKVTNVANATVGTDAVSQAYGDARYLGISATAGGALSGNYPNPGLASGVAGGGIGISGNVLSVAAGTGITQNADGVGIDTAVVPQKAVANTFTAEQTFDPATDAVGITVLASATANAFRVRDAGNTANVAYITPAGKVFGTGLDAGSAVVSNVADAAANGDAVSRSFGDTRYINSGEAAGGALSGTYPNPGLATGVAGAGIGISGNVLSITGGSGIQVDADGVTVDSTIARLAGPTFTGTVNVAAITASGAATFNGNVVLGNAAADTIGFYGATPLAQQTGYPGTISNLSAMPGTFSATGTTVNEVANILGCLVRDLKDIGLIA